MSSVQPSQAAYSSYNVFQAVRLLFNAQHDCIASQCNISGTAFQLQERQKTDKVVSTVSHKDNPWYVINTHAFHNAMKLRKILPRHLTQPKHYYPNRRERQLNIAKELVVTQQAKREETKRKTAETRAKNKAAKEAEARKLAAASGEEMSIDTPRLVTSLSDGAETRFRGNQRYPCQRGWWNSSRFVSGAFLWSSSTASLSDKTVRN
jgi:hypothetical protein